MQPQPVRHRPAPRLIQEALIECFESVLVVPTHIDRSVLIALLVQLTPKGPSMPEI
jgi:hypothetical protein